MPDPAASANAPEPVDVLIVGAGISGIDAAYHLQRRCSDKSWLILEARGAIGGTWDLFRYPGIRSDSDMYTLGYAFKPWTEQKAIADGPSIWNYVNETAREHGVDKHIRFKHRVTRCAWDSNEARWTVEAEHAGGVKRFNPARARKRPTSECVRLSNWRAYRATLEFNQWRKH